MMVFKLKSLVAVAAFYSFWINISYAQSESQVTQKIEATEKRQDNIAKATGESAGPDVEIKQVDESTIQSDQPPPVVQQLTAKQVIELFQAELLDTMKQGKTLGFEGRYEKLNEPVLKSHDLSKIARIVLGKEWKKLTVEQKKTMVDLFTRLSIASYAHNFKEFSGEAFKFESEDQTSRGGVIIHTYLVLPNDKDVKFDYMMKSKGNSWRIINIIANGVSDLALKRSEYTSILKREGFDALLAKISGKIEKYSMQ